MKQQHWLAIAIAILWATVSPVYAMEQQEADFGEALPDRFPGFVTMDRSVLERVIARVPTEPSKERCAKIQCLHMLAWAHLITGGEPSSDLNFIGSAIDPRPHKFADFINMQLPLTCQYLAEAVRFHDLDGEHLIGIVKYHVNDGQPLMAYYMDGGKMRINTIVGYRDREGNDQSARVLVLDNGGAGLERLKTIDADRLIKLMDLKRILSQLAAFCAHIAYTDENCANDRVCAWKSFNFIIFEKTKVTIVDEKTVAKPNSDTWCISQ